MFYVVTYKGVRDTNVRVMSFKYDKRAAQDLVDILGEGAEYEAILGTFPQDERTAAFLYELHKKRHGLRLVEGL
jgi:hypothetical protein